MQPIVLLLSLSITTLPELPTLPPTPSELQSSEPDIPYPLDENVPIKDLRVKPAQGVIPEPSVPPQYLPGEPSPNLNSNLVAPTKKRGWEYDLGYGTMLSLSGVGRGYYLNDQRIEWSGVEATFGAEGVLSPRLQSIQGNYRTAMQGEIFFNMPYGTSILTDPERDLYRANFGVQPVQFFQLYGELEYSDWTFRIGKVRTPFGRYEVSSFNNAQHDAPFIRTDIIGFVEVGIFGRYEGSWYTVDLGVINGEADLDTNSSKGAIGRFGINLPRFQAGLSFKYQDGISSEYQKRFNDIIGIDMTVNVTKEFLLYGEAIYDRHGFNRDPVLAIDKTTFGVRNLYGREVFYRDGPKITGTGYYLGAGYRGDRFSVDLIWGEYTPQQIGIPLHDEMVKRGVVKTSYMVTDNFQFYIWLLSENNRTREGVLAKYRPYGFAFGAQYLF